jgi:hypothetical protein
MTMNDGSERYREMRDVWADYNRRQEFEHQLLDRKTTWLLTTQAILFAAYGVTFDSKPKGEHIVLFQKVVSGAGSAIAVITFLGVVGLIRSKLTSWKDYREHYNQQRWLKPPEPVPMPLPWGVRNRNTWLTLVPDIFLPIVFFFGWGAIILFVFGWVDF